jgi:hypothetical protein
LANNYTQWCIGIEFASPEEKEWFQTTVKNMQEYSELFSANPDKQENAADFEEMEKLKSALGSVANTFDELREYVSFEVSYTSKDGKEVVYIESTEVADPSEVEYLLQAYLQKFHPTKSISLSWASWCDKSRVNEFGGGGVFITANEISHMNSWDWLEEREKELLSKKPKKGGKKK